MNRIVTAFTSWENRLQEMEPMLNPADSRLVARLQLDHLRKAGHRMRGDLQLHEQPFMHLLDNQIARLEKQIWPNKIERFIRGLKDHFVDGPKYLQQQTAQRQANMAALKTQLKAQGFFAISGKLEEHLHPEAKSKVLPLNCQLGEGKSIQFNLQFEKNREGNFELDNFHTVLHQDGVPQNAYQFDTKDWPDLKTTQAWSLLEGRALKQDFIDAEGKESKRWVQLSPEGVKHYDDSYGYDLTKIIHDIKEISPTHKAETIGYLENGQCVSAYWKINYANQPIRIQADPASKGVKMFDEHMKSTDPEKLAENVRLQKPCVRFLTTKLPPKLKKNERRRKLL